MTNSQKLELQLFACNVRESILTATHSAASGHPGGSLSCADMLSYIYLKRMNVTPKNVQDLDRNRFVLSKGHCAPALYSILAELGFFPKDELLTLRKPGSILQGHPSMRLTPGVDMSTGSLGQGISAACGMAKGSKLTNKNFCVYTLLGDGELAEGEVWEALMFAAHYKLDNLCVIVDINGLQIDGATKDVMNTEPVLDKFKAFGFNTTVINGHDFEEIDSALNGFDKNKNSGIPYAILMKTTKGKGVSFMENDAEWHGKAPNDEQYTKAIAEIKAKKQSLEANI